MHKDFKETAYTPILLIVVFLLLISVNFIPENTLGIEENPYLAVVVIQLLTYAVPSLFYSKLRGKDLTPHLRVRLIKPSRLLYVAYMSVIMVCGVLLLSVLMYTLFPDSFADSSVREYAAFTLNDSFFGGAYLILAFAILPAVTEEYLFRGIVIGEYEKNGAFTAVLMSSLMFAMSHFSLVRLPIYIFSGIVLGCAVYATRSLLASVIIHAVNNTAVILCERYVLHIVDKQNVSLVLLILIAVAILLVSAMLMCYEAYGIYRSYAEASVESPYAKHPKKGALGRFTRAFFSPTFLILVIIFVLRTVSK